VDIVITCHTELGFFQNSIFIADKRGVDGVTRGVSNLQKISEKYGAKISFAVMPDVIKYFPQTLDHEIGLHIHPGHEKFNIQGCEYFAGDLYLKEHCYQSCSSSVLKDYPYKEQLDMIKTGKDIIYDNFGINPTSFVAGRWSINNETVKALIQCKITHDCSASAHSKAEHYDWSRIPRICMPYHPSRLDYQTKGDLPLIILPISQMYRVGNVNPEVISSVGVSWLKACFSEYYTSNAPVFHICLHSPSMTNPAIISAFDVLLKFISRHKNIHFKQASEIIPYHNGNIKSNLIPYFFGLNFTLIKTFVEMHIKNEVSGIK
jgi:peptidoglycan/xylan/chitin deacetylase (PgdA/CDA1 family)